MSAMKKIAMLGIILALTGVAQSQPVVLWQTALFDTVESSYGWSILQTSDTSFVLGGERWAYYPTTSDGRLWCVDTSGATRWIRDYTSNNAEGIHSVWEKYNTHFINGGYGVDGGIPLNGDMWLVETDHGGNFGWWDYHDFGCDYPDACWSIQQLISSDYILGGYTMECDSGIYTPQFAVEKASTMGAILWQRQWGWDGEDVCFSIEPIPGGFIMGGVTERDGTPDMYLAKLDNTGNVIWDRTYGGLGEERCFCVHRTPDGGYLLGGLTDSYGAGGKDMYVVKTNSFGLVQFEETYGGPQDEICRSLKEAPYTGYVLAGKSNSFGVGQDEIYVVRIDDIGNVAWEQTYGPAIGGMNQIANSVDVTFDNGYILGGTKGMSAITGWMLMARLSSETPPSASIVLTPDTSTTTIPATGDTLEFTITTTNNTSSILPCQIWTFAYRPNGRPIPLTGPMNVQLAPNATRTKAMKLIIPAVASPGEYSYFACIGNFSTPVAWDCDFFNFTKLVVSGFCGENLNENWTVIDTESDETSSAAEVVRRPETKNLEVAPNPFNPTTTIHFELPEKGAIRLSVFDVSGRQVAELVNGVQEAGNHAITFNGSNLPSGMYFARLTTPNSQQMQKLLLVK